MIKINQEILFLFDKSIQEELDLLRESQIDPTQPSLSAEVLDTLQMYRRLIVDGAPVNRKYLDSLNEDLYRATRHGGHGGDIDYADDFVDAIFTLVHEKDLYAD